MHAFEKIKVPEGSIGIHWFGQNSFAFKDSTGTILLIDPYFPKNRPPDEFIHPLPPLEEHEIKTDYVLLTHDHGDHTCPESLLRINAAFPQARYYGPFPSIKRLKELGISEKLAYVVAAGEKVRLEKIVLHAVWSKPPEGIAEDSIPIPDTEHLGYVIEMGRVRIYISGDIIRTFSKHDDLLSPIIKLKPDIGFLTTHPTEGEFPDFAGSVEMAVKLGLKNAVPSHYDCFIKRTFDPAVWASGFFQPNPKPIIIAYNESIIYHP